MISRICRSFSLYSSDDGSTIVGIVFIVLACEGVQWVATFRLAARIAKGVVLAVEEGMRLESLRAPREALNVDIVAMWD